MIIDAVILDSLTSAAKSSPRLRMNYDLRTSPADTSQRMLNALEPGTEVPIHRHRKTTEVVVMLRGRGVQYLYDDEGNIIDEVELDSDGPCRMMTVDVGQWHNLKSLESGTVIFECKDGRYEPLEETDIQKK